MRKYILTLLLLLPLLAFSQVKRFPFYSASSTESLGDSTSLAEVWYHFEDNVTDVSGNGVNGTYSGLYSNSIYKEGTRSITFESSDICTLDAFTLNDTFAVCFWYYHEDLESEGSNCFMPLRGTVGVDGWSIRMDQLGGDIEHLKYVASTTYGARTTNGWLTTAHDTWLFIIVQIEGPTTTFYINNVNRTSIDPTTVVDDHQTDQLTIGQGVNSNVDDFRIFNFLLTSAQRTRLYEQPGYYLEEAL